jgi:radical SAM protein with 4Fe4S-binding SPASM domain
MTDYTFSKTLPAEFPSQIMVDLTEVCNLGCIHCPHPLFKRSSHYSKQMLDENLNNKMISEVAEHGLGKTKYIRYTSNGEPLVHPRSYSMIYEAVKRSKTKVTLTTNGTLMDRKRVEKIFASGLHMIDISIDAFTNETYAKVRVGGNLDITRKNVIDFIKLSKEKNIKTKIVVSFVEQKENTFEKNDFKNFWTNEGADEVLIRELHSNSGNTKLDEYLSEKKEEQLQKRYPCIYPWERVVLNPRGFLSFCPTDWYGKAEIIDYNKTTIKEIWQSKFYKDLRQQHVCNKFKNEFCKNCPDWSNTHWPHFKEKKRYGDLVEKLLG